MNEISAKLEGSFTPQAVSLDALSQGYEIKFKCELNDETRDVLRALAARNGLRLEENRGFVVIKR